MGRRPPSMALLAATLVCAVGCDGGGAGAGSGSAAASPPDGQWQGDYLDLRIEGGVVQEVWLKGVSCAKPDPNWSSLMMCTSEPVDGPVDDALQVVQADNAMVGGREWRLQGAAGPATSLYAVFSSSGQLGNTLDVVNGVFDYAAAGDCDCSTRFNFEARFVPPEGFVPPDGTPSPGTGGGGAPETPNNDGLLPEDADEAQSIALSRVNMYRQQVGVPAVDMHSALNTMATDHCACYVANMSSYEATGMSPHDEDASWGGSCHGGLGQRAENVNYTAISGEVMAFIGDPTAAVDGWMATLYHRLPLISPQTAEIGYGQAPGCDTINTGWAQAAGEQAEVVYPYPGQADVDTCWDGLESPQPPKPGGYPSGPIITLEHRPGANWRLSAASFTSEGGSAVPHVLVVPKGKGHVVGTEDPYLPAEACSLYSDEPLEPSTTYTIKLQGELQAQPWEKTWTFTTAPQPGGCWFQ